MSVRNRAVAVRPSRPVRSLGTVALLLAAAACGKRRHGLPAVGPDVTTLATDADRLALRAAGLAR